MDVEIGAEAALFPGKEYISGIFIAVQATQPGGTGSLESILGLLISLKIRAQLA
jgi:hypothetical protein